jgi:hypothetical protein
MKVCSYEYSQVGIFTDPNLVKHYPVKTVCRIALTTLNSFQLTLNLGSPGYGVRRCSL